ncbi:hypothetical protein QBC36DRAFT_46784 [Triangularia setosa]|uniref:Uncharacterized protein n=1 Tax=Triangularia setosa TaxID=2587417 RepID=A0AAN6WDN3_9PEZI|nr:hypothetical protein QBC36DRAFT_46784 [Podospora setosa]
MSSNQQTAVIKVEEPQGKLSWIYLHSVTIPGIPSASRQFTKPCSYPYTSEKSSRQNEISLSVIRSILSDHFSLKATKAILEWRLTDSTESSCPLFTTRHKITDTTSTVGGQGFKIVFADSLDWAQKIMSNQSTLRKARQDARAHLKTTTHLTPPLFTGAGKLPRHQQHGISKRRRRGQPPYTQQPCLDIIDELRRRAEQHYKATGDVFGLLQAMQVQQFMMTGRRNSNTCHQQNIEPRCLSPSTISVCSGR